MPPALTPELAIAYVRELSADVRAVAALSATGERVAGDAAVAAAARALIAAAPDAAELEVVTAGGVACAVRGTRHALVAACGPFAIGGIVRQDLRTAIGALEPGAPPPAEPPPATASEPPSEPLETLAEALFTAAQRAPEA